MKLPLVPSSDEFVVMGETIEEQLKKEEDEYPNSMTVQKKRRIDSVVRKISEEELKKEKE